MVREGKPPAYGLMAGETCDPTSGQDISSTSSSPTATVEKAVKAIMPKLLDCK